MKAKMDPGWKRAYRDTAPDYKLARSAAFAPPHRPNAHRPIVSPLRARSFKRPEGRAPGAGHGCARWKRTALNSHAVPIYVSTGSAKSLANRSLNRVRENQPSLRDSPRPLRLCVSAFGRVVFNCMESAYAPLTNFVRGAVLSGALWLQVGASFHRAVPAGRCCRCA